MSNRTQLSKGYQTVIPASIRKAHNIMPGDVLEWKDTEAGIILQSRKKVTLKDITGLIEMGEVSDAVELKKRVQRGEKL